MGGARSACLTTGTHYLDITGEIVVFESVMPLDEEAKAVGVALLPGVCFDVVPTDCLAASLAEALADATHLELAFSASGGSASRGTLKTLIETVPNAGGTLSVGLLRRPGPGGWDRQSALKEGCYGACGTLGG